LVRTANEAQIYHELAKNTTAHSALKHDVLAQFCTLTLAERCR